MNRYDDDPFMNAGSFGGNTAAGFTSNPLEDSSVFPNAVGVGFGGNADASDSSAPQAAHLPSSTNRLLQQAHEAMNNVNFSAGSLEKTDAELPADSFEVTVSDPTTVGDGLKSYTTYKITVKTTAKEYRGSEMAVNRRFREFLWLETQLGNNNPGIIIPPAPDKMALGRFEEDFVSNRRDLLERMLRRIVAHPVLQKDNDLRIFLESDTFKFEVQDKKKKEENKSSFMSKLGDAMSNAVTAVSKVEEPDEFFENKRQYIDQLEGQFKALLKAVDALTKQREELGNALNGFGESITAMAGVELNKDLEQQLKRFSETQKSIGAAQLEQTYQDVYTLANTVDEYVRLIGAVKAAFAARLKALQNWRTAEQSLIKARINLEKNRLNAKSKPDKLAQLESEIKDGEEKVVTTKREFELISQRLKAELAKFEDVKVQDLQECMKEFLSSIHAHHKKVIDLWEKYIQEYEH